ncbi:MAG: tail fiber domain-containing protein [Bacteroidales bacterium]
MPIVGSFKKDGTFLLSKIEVKNSMLVEGLATLTDLKINNTLEVVGNSTFSNINANNIISKFLEGDGAKVTNIQWNNIVKKPTTISGYGITDAYTKTETDTNISNAISELRMNIQWKDSVPTFADLETTYPTPKEGWTVSIEDTNEIYRYDDSTKKWIQIDAGKIPMASALVDGKMSKEHFVKVESIQTGAEVNQNAYSSIKVGSKTATATTKTDTFEMAAGSDIGLAMDGKKVTISHATIDTLAPSKSTNSGSANILYSIATDKGHVISSTYKTITAGTNIEIDAVNSRGDIKISNTYRYTHPTGDGNLHVPATGTTNDGKFLTAGANPGDLSWTTPPLATTRAAGYLKQLTGTTNQFMRADGNWATPIDTTYNEYVGTIAGLVPNGTALTPADKTSKFLRGDGKWEIPYTLPTATTTTLGGIVVGTGLAIASGKLSVPTVTTVANGLMLSSDKTKLDGIATNANNYVHPTISRNNSSNTVSPGYSGTFTVIDSVTSNAEGHISAVNTKTITMPSIYTLPKATKTTLGGVIVGDNINVGADGKISIANYEPAFTKNTAFNKNFGTASGTVSEGNHTHGEFTNSRNMIATDQSSNAINFNTNKDFISTNRIIRLGTTQTGLGTTPNYGTVMVLHGGGDTGAQLQFPYNSNEIYFRNYSFAATPNLEPKAWSRIWNSTNFNPTTKADVVRKINVSGAITGGGDLTADRTIGHSTAAGYVHLPSGGSAGQWLKWASAGTGAWTTPGVLVRGSYLTGNNYDGNSGTTWAVDATTDATPSKVVARDSAGDVITRTTRTGLVNQNTMSGAIAFRINDSTDNFTRYCSDPAAVRNWLGVENSLTSYVRKTGDTMTGSLRFTDGHSIELNIPNTTGGHARGYIFKSTSNATVLGGMGYLGNGENITYMAIGMANGSDWWSGDVLKVYTDKVMFGNSTIWNSTNLTFGTGESQMAKGNHTHVPSQVGLSNVPNTIHTTDATASTVPLRDSAGDITSRLFKSTYANENTLTGAIAFRVNNASDNYIRYCSNPASVRAWLNLEGSLTSYVQKAGDTMTGVLTVPAGTGLRTSNATVGSETYYTGISAESGYSMLWRRSADANKADEFIGITRDSRAVVRLATGGGKGNYKEGNIYHSENKPTKADVGLGSVNNWGASSNINANSTAEYATTNMVAQIKALVETTGSDYIKSLGILPAETERNTHRVGAYTFNTNNATLGDSTPTAYWSTIGFGRGTQGMAEIACDWTSNGNNLWFRSLRDTQDNWFSWKRIYHTGYKPSAVDVGLGNVNNWGASNDASNNSASTYATTNMVHNRIGNVNNWGASSDINANSTTQYATTNMVAQVRKASFKGFGTMSENNANNALTQGMYSFGGAIINGLGPQERYGKILVYLNDDGTHNNSNNWIWQDYMDTSGGKGWRQKTNGGDWTAWRTYWDSGNFDPNSKLNTVEPVVAQGWLFLGDRKSGIMKGENHSVRLGTAHGSIDIGPQNGSHCHIYTTVPSFYFNKDILINGARTMVDSGTYDTIYLNNWIRTNGGSGLYFQSFGGGWHMTDGTWIRTYNSKPIHVSGADITCTNNIIAYYSDERLKKNFTKIENAIEKIMSINPYYYEQNDFAKELGYKEEGKIQLGFKAQDMERILPQVIMEAPVNHRNDLSDETRDKIGDKPIMTIDYGKITPLLWKAIQEQQKEIEELKRILESIK